MRGKCAGEERATRYSTVWGNVLGSSCARGSLILSQRSRGLRMTGRHVATGLGKSVTKHYKFVASNVEKPRLRTSNKTREMPFLLGTATFFK